MLSVVFNLASVLSAASICSALSHRQEAGLAFCHPKGLFYTEMEFLGRGDPTMSLSCSDKMLKWNLVGLQGSVLAAVFSGPIRWSSVVVGGDQFDEAAVRRAVFERTGNLFV